MTSLPEISAVSYDICGVVRMVGSGYKAKVNSYSYLGIYCSVVIFYLML